jgi:hypothetical protein
VSEEALLVGDVLFDGLVDELETLGRQQDKHPASIPWIRLAGEQADSLQAVDALGNCAGGHHHRLGERPRRELVRVARPEQAGQHVELAAVEGEAPKHSLQRTLELARESIYPP